MQPALKHRHSLGL